MDATTTKIKKKMKKEELRKEFETETGSMPMMRKEQYLKWLEQKLLSRPEPSVGKFKEAVSLIEYFIKRCEEGTIISKTTYAMYKNFIATLTKQGSEEEGRGE